MFGFQMPPEIYPSFMTLFPYIEKTSKSPIHILLSCCASSLNWTWTHSQLTLCVCGEARIVEKKISDILLDVYETLLKLLCNDNFDSRCIFGKPPTISILVRIMVWSHPNHYVIRICYKQIKDQLIFYLSFLIYKKWKENNFI